MTDPTPISFADLGLSESVLAAVRAVGYESPSPIQQAAIPPLLGGRDVLGQAQTGTGKTAAFALPLLCRIDVKRVEPQLLVLTPTRELAIQVAEAMQTYARHLKGFHVLPVYGGTGMDLQLKQLRRGVHAVVGTPGRIQDHLRRKTLKLGNISAVVIDEADEMLRMGFIDDVESILGEMPDEKQVALFSATLPDRIRKVVAHHLKDPVEIKVKTKTATVEAVDQRFVEVRGFDKLDTLTRILEAEDFDAMLIFVRTRQATAELSEKLEARGLASAALSGEMTQVARERTIERLKAGKLDIVVATDVAARGLDVERITHVVNYDVPYDVEGYIHRIGRTGRAGRAGHAILFVTPRERRMLSAIERATRQRVQLMRLPSREDVADRRAAQFKDSITEVLGSQDLKFFEQLVASYVEEHAREPQKVAAALAYLAQKDRPLKPPPAPESRREQFTERAPLHAGRRGHKPPRDAEPRSERPRRTARAEKNLVRYRIEVGREHGVQPGNIVGAIANEAGIDSVHIGRIEIFDSHSIVGLPAGMPKDAYQRLRKAWVCGQQLSISVDSADDGPTRLPPGVKSKRKSHHHKPKRAHD
jgi:ATP-dependent RNA helicase DeaD